METRKRKEVPESTGEDDSEIAERPSKSREPNAKEDEETDKTQVGPTEVDIEASPETNAAAVAAAAITNTIDAAALPSGTPATEPAIDAATGDPPTAPTEGSLELDAAAGGVGAVAPKVLPKPSTSEELEHWNQMFFDLMLYRIGNGNVNVKSTDRAHADLYKWIVQLRKDYKARERDPSESTLTEEQISVLESVRFAFTTRGEEHWQKNYDKLKEYKASHGHVLVPRQCEIPGLGDWVTSQRQQYQEYTKGRPTPLTKQRKELLDEIGFQFRIRNRPEWSSKYEEILSYKEKNGDTRVPQHYKVNKALGKWVAKQREQFKLHKKGRHSFLTPDRLEKLNSIGFVWSVRGESSSTSSTTEKNETNASPDSKGEPTTISVVDAIMAKPADTEQEGEEKASKDDKDEENVPAASLAAVPDGETATV